MVATASSKRIARNIADVAVDGGIDALVTLEQTRKALLMADRSVVRAMKRIRQTNTSNENASRQINATARKQLVGVA